MKRNTLCLTALLLLVTGSAFTQTVPQSMNFQGRLARPDGTPVPDTSSQTLTLRLFAAINGGNALWQQAISNVAVHNGAFAIPLNFAAGYQNGNTLATVFGNPLFTPYLEIQVGSVAPFAPRQPFASVAYSLYAGTALSVPDGSITNAKIAAGTITPDKFASSILSGVWSLTGNAGINPLTQFLGTTDNQPLILKVNNRQAMRVSYAENTATAGQEFRAPNILGGSEINTITPGVVGATIAGGGLDFFTGQDYPNTVTGDFGAVGGGLGNSSSKYAMVGGGNQNVASGVYATVGGGASNKASNVFATVAGGISNIAAGYSSFAAGQQAQANHDGSFVWNDVSNLNIPFGSTDANQFLIHAAGGVGIGTNSPRAYAQVSGDSGNTSANFHPQVVISSVGNTSYGAFLEMDATPSGGSNYRIYSSGIGDGTAGSLIFQNTAARITPLVLQNNGNVGINTNAPGYTLDVNGSVRFNNGNDLVMQAAVGSVDAGDFVFRAGDGTEKARIYSDPNNTNSLFLRTSGHGPSISLDSNGNVGIGNALPGVKLDVAGEIRGTVITITGGSDVAEPYNVAPAGEVNALPGMLVVIDSEKVGQMRVASRAYDTAVAGIISGANGIRPGITLTQKGAVADGSLPVASIGRVWCWCDADANGPIEAGDMLTSSNTSGHAMKATDRERRDGAVIGKAMSSLKSGRGLVLVLVSLK